MKAADAKSRGSSQNAGKASRAPQPFFGGGRRDFGQREHFFPRAPKIQRQPFFPKGPIQPKLSVGQPGDPFEQEADRVAERVVTGRDVAAAAGNSSPSFTGVQRKPIFESEGTPELQSKPLSSMAGAAPPIQANAAAPVADELQNDQETSGEEPLQREPIFAGGSAAPGDTIRRKGDGTPSISPATMSSIQSPGSGAPLSPAVRSRIEPSLSGGDLSGVRVHRGPAANDAASSLGARAFTHGNNIWLGPGESSSDLRLMAHEATHVAQQSGGATRGAMIQRNGPAAATAGEGELSGQTVSFEQLPVPAWKVSRHSGAFARPQGYSREAADEEADETQRGLWKGGPGAAATPKTILTNKINQAYNGQPPAGQTAFAFRTPGGIYAPATPEQLAASMSIPRWDKQGHPKNFDVDHKRELQLGGLNELGNLELVKDRVNRSSGSSIASSINKKARAFAQKQSSGAPATREQGDQVKRDYALSFGSAVASGRGVQPEEGDIWTNADITAGEHVKLPEVTPLTSLGGPGRVVVFPGSDGGVGIEFNTEGPLTAEERAFLKPFNILQKTFNTEAAAGGGQLGSLTVNAPSGHKHWKPLPQNEVIPISAIPGAQYAGNIDRAALQAALLKLRHAKLSPIQIDTFDLAGGIHVRGRIQPSIPLLEQAQIGFEITGDDVSIFKEFSISEISVPPPLRVSGATLVVSVGTAGLSVEGRVDFGIDRVGQGFLEARVGTSEGFALEGEFNFDSKLFDPAKVSASYRDGIFSFAGELGIPPGKVRGIRSAQIRASYSQERFEATGTVQPEIPGVQQAAISVSHSPAEGLIIGGTLQLANAPGIASGSLAVRAQQKPDGAWKLSGTGTAVPAIPGISTTLNITYDDGLFDIRGSASYQRGMLSGSVEVGVTNRPLADGQPSGEPGPTLRLYGGGTLTIRIAPWLQGTIGVRLLPNGELEVSGQIGLPGSVQIFDRKEINKSIFQIAVQAPIFPGIVAEIGGGLGAVAGIGPGMLEQLQLGITYNPSHEEQTRVTGDARLRVPANAGLRLSVRAGIGLGITGASATGGLEIGGTLGIEGAAEASVHVEWTPTTGLDLTAEVALHAQPSFTFDLSGYVSVTALGFSVYDKTWQLASFRFGSDYRFGIRLPVHYREGQPFNISLDDVQFEVPQVSPGELLQGLINRIA